MSTRLVIKKSTNSYATHDILHRMVTDDKEVYDIVLAQINVNTGKVTLYTSGMWNVPEVKLCDWSINGMGLQVKKDNPEWVGY